MHVPPGKLRKGNSCIRIKKALYGLRRSPSLRQRKWTAGIPALGFKQVPQEAWVMTKGGIISFFFVDHIVFAYCQQDSVEVNEAVERFFT